MPIGSIFTDKKARYYLFIIFIGIFILMLLPLLFYMLKFVKNPSVFEPVSAKYMTIEVETKAMIPQKIKLIHVGDVYRNQNGEEIARIISILKTEPGIVGTALLEGGKRVRIISEKKVVKLLLKIQYDNIEDVVMLRSVCGEPIVGRELMLIFTDPEKTRKYDLYFTITRLGVRDDKNP